MSERATSTTAISRQRSLAVTREPTVPVAPITAMVVVGLPFFLWLPGKGATKRARRRAKFECGFGLTGQSVGSRD